jgi:two-component system, chemotaxis family, chemotaxis protein CheY
MIVDDSSMSRRIMREILESGGHDVTEAQDGMAALEMYFLQKPNVVMLDLIMRGMYGIDVLKKLRELDPDARVIVASADIQVSTRRLVEDAGGVAFVSKPFTRTDILEAVDAAIAGELNGLN